MSYEGERIAVAAVSWTSAFKGGGRRAAFVGDVLCAERSGVGWRGS